MNKTQSAKRIEDTEQNDQPELTVTASTAVAGIAKLDPITTELISTAERKQHEFKKSPELVIFADQADEQDAILRRYAPECIGPDATHRAAFISTRGSCRENEDLPRKYAMKGWEPVIEKATGRAVRFRTSIVMRLPIEMARKQDEVDNAAFLEQRNEALTPYDVTQSDTGARQSMAVVTSKTVNIQAEAIAGPLLEA